MAIYYSPTMFQLFFIFSNSDFLKKKIESHIICMKKIYFLHLIIICVARMCLLTFMAVGITACDIAPELSREETIRIELPEWPPQDSFSQSYPELSRWKIVITKAATQTCFYSDKSFVEVSVEKNEPFSLLAYPITCLENNTECSYFKPAGFLYPWILPDSPNATWEQGFLADCMAKFFRDAQESCNSPQESAWKIRTFNWKKAQEVIDAKISETSADKPFYNPWFINYSALLENLAASEFKQSLLNTTGCYSISTDYIKAATETSSQKSPILSSFIPENDFISSTNQITVKKNTPYLISTVKKYGIIVTFKSSKNISLAFIYLPIYIEDI